MDPTALSPRLFLLVGRAFWRMPDGSLLPRVAGGDGEPAALPQEIAGPLAQLAELEDEQLAELETALQEHMATLPDGEEEDVTDDDIAAATAVLDALSQVRAEAASRFERAEAAEAEAAERRERLAEIRAQAEGEGEIPPEGEETPEGEPAPEGEEQHEGGEGPQPAQHPGTAPAPEAEAPEPVAAAARPPSHRPSIGRVAARRPAPRQPAPSSRVPSTMVAAADIAGFAAGQAIPDLEQLADAIVARADALRGVTAGADGMKYHVARLRAEYPEERRLSRDNAQLSQQRMDAATGLQARVASGGLCAPLTPDYSQLGLSDDSRPGWSSLPHFNADRGGVRWVPPPRFSRGVLGGNAYKAGVGTWTAANDANPTNPATKPVARVDCAAEDTAVVEATTKRLEIGNFFNMTFRERVQAIMDVLNAEFAAVSETKLLDKIAVLATADVSTGQGLGAARDLLSHLDLAVAGFENRWRMAESHTPLRLWYPDWVHDLMRADLTRALNTGRTIDEQLAVADAQIDAAFRARNVTPTWLMDGETGAGQTFGPQGDGAIENWPTNVVGYLFHDGALRVIDAGTLDLGIIRDSVLADTNDLQLFMEEFWNVIFQGWEVLRLNNDVCPDGSSAGSVDYNPCAVGS